MQTRGEIELLCIAGDAPFSIPPGLEGLSLEGKPLALCALK